MGVACWDVLQLMPGQDHDTRVAYARHRSVRKPYVSVGRMGLPARTTATPEAVEAARLAATGVQSNE